MLDSRADLDTLADATFTTNGVGGISGAELNDGYKRLADSALIKNEAGDLGAGLGWAANLLKIAAAGVTLAMLENRAQATFLGRKAAAGSGAPQEMSASEAKTILAIAAGDVSGLSAFATSTDLVAASGTLAIARIGDGSVTLAKLANLAQATIIGRASGAGSGVPTALAASDLSTILGLAAVATSGSASDLGTGTLPIARIADGAVTLAKLENRTQATFIGRKAAAGTGVPQEMSASEAKTILAIAASDVSGLAAVATSGSASDLGTGTLPIARIADGAVTLAKLENRTQATFIGRKAAAGTGVPQEMTAAEAKTILAISTSDVSGLGTAALKNTGTSGNNVSLLDGANTWSAQQIISLTGTAAGLIIDTTDAGANLGGNLILRRSSASPAVSDFLNSVEHHGLSSTGVERVYVRTYGQIILPTNAAENGGWYVDTIRAGTVTNEIFVAGGVQLSNPSGGFKGVGTLNALQLYQNGALITSLATSASASDITTGTLNIARIADGDVTLAKMANLAQSTIIGRAAAAGTGVPTALTGSQVKTILAIAAADVSGLSAFATSTDLANATGILAIARVADATVTYAKLQNIGAVAVMGRSAGTSGVAADIQASNDGDILRRSGSTIGFGSIATAGIADAQVTLAKMANLTQSTIIGRAAGAGTGVPTALSAAQVKTLLAIAQADVTGLTTADSPTFAGLTVSNNNSLIVGAGAWTVTGYGRLLTSQNAAYTFVLLDAGSTVRHNSASAHNYTIPPNSSVAFPVGTQIGFANIGAGNLTIARGVGVACFASGVDTNASFGGTIFGFITKLNTDTWALTEI